VDLPSVTREADILVAAIGKPAMVTAGFVKPGAVVIDVGTNSIADRTLAAELVGEDSPRMAAFDKKGSLQIGDVHPRSVLGVAGYLTPVPGGVGPLTIAMLMSNTVKAATMRRNIA
jgi:methylenetetrahydrofolate dehydrogenase (NADP+) / methenyltetrahydrofolate cyclohydrolase